MENNEKIVQLIRMRGPVLPSDISKIVGTNLLFTSAILSELVTKNELKLSYLKIGGSPLYYTKGQEDKLQQFSNKLHEKEKKAYDLLKERKVLQDIKLEPVIRVALRQIKDFAVPLQVNIKNNLEIFWKWYLISNEEALTHIKNQINIPPSEPEKVQEQVQKKPVSPEEFLRETTESPPKPIKEKKDVSTTKKFVDYGDNFYNAIKRFFNKNNITILKEDIKKKKNDFEFVIEIPSTVGSVEFFCKAKDKKLINDKDLAMASIQGQANKLPVLFLTRGNPTKKAAEMLLKEFKTIKIKQI